LPVSKLHAIGDRLRVICLNANLQRNNPEDLIINVCALADQIRLGSLPKQRIETPDFRDPRAQGAITSNPFRFV
jgi:hypothetical protein